VLGNAFCLGKVLGGALTMSPFTGLELGLMGGEEGGVRAAEVLGSGFGFGTFEVSSSAERLTGCVSATHGRLANSI